MARLNGLRNLGRNCGLTAVTLVAILTGLISIAAAENAVLRLNGGDYVTGRLVDSPLTDVLSWRSPAFALPLPFPLAAIKSVDFPVPDKLPKPVGEYCFEMADGDVLFGSLASITADEVAFDVAPFGTLHVDKSYMRRMYRWNGGKDLVFIGPKGLKGWEMSGPRNAWSEEAGQLVSNQPQATIRQNFKLPPQARFEFELSWTGKPDFELALGANGKPSDQPFRFEVLDDDLVVQREVDRKADLAFIKSVKSGTGNVHLIAFLDQVQERLLVYSSNGEPKADLTVHGRPGQTLGGVQLTNRNGNIRLEQLRISHWNGELPRAVEADRARVHLTDGSIVYGQLKSYDAQRREFQVVDGDSVQTIRDDRVVDLFLSRQGEIPDRPLRLASLNGQQISGSLEKIEQETVWLMCPGIRESLPFPIASLQSLAVLSKPSKDRQQLPSREGRIQFEGTVLHGCLADGTEADGGCLIWQSRGAGAAIPLVRGVSAQIIYRDPVAPVAEQMPNEEVEEQVARRRAQQGLAGRVQEMLVGSNARPRPTVRGTSKSATAVLHLRSGDKLPCTNVSTDEQGVTFKSSVTDATFVKHDQVKVVELFPEAPRISIAKSKRERLLMLPRMQRDNPPTQLVRSITGDYLRGRLLAINEHEIMLELRLEEKTIPRETVARIIWLHADELNSTAPPVVSPDPSATSRVQAVPRDGNRLTFIADQFAGTVLSGRSDILGACRVDVEKLDQLLMGAAIEHAAQALTFHQWRLKQAIDPLESPDGGGDSDEGRESVLVGKPAPDIELDLLDGTKFRLADYKGKVVVLDFWASWCGPCLQAMPQVDAVANEFADKNVMLVAINLEEPAEKVKGALERLKLDTTVALDHNGRVAERYGVSAIPQTVIVDREGKVARLFVGGGARFGEQLKTALQAVLADRPAATDADQSAEK